MEKDFSKEIISNLINSSGGITNFELRISPPCDCSFCPLGAESVEEYNDISNDLAEANYFCPLLHKEIWGEEPLCDDILTELVYEYLKKQ